MQGLTDHLLGLLEFQHVLYAQSISALLFGITFHLKVCLQVGNEF